ncbi:MAG: zinc-dependent metalloprotease [Fimbriimonas sp.]
MSIIPIRAFSLVLLFAVTGSALTQTAPDAKKEEPKKEEPKRDPKSLDYEKAVKDLKKIDGPFVIYQRRKDVLIELPEDKIGKVFYIQAAFNTGVDPFNLQAGAPIGNNAVDAFRWEKNEESVSIVRPNLKYRWDKSDPLALASERTFPEAILGTFRIEQTNPEKKLLLVNATALLNGDYLRLNEMIGALLGGPYQLDRERSGVEKVKGFAENTIVQMKLHYASPRGGGGSQAIDILGLGGGNHLEDDRSASMKVTYNLWYPKETTYKPRLSDPRVGYFTQDFYDVGRFYNRDRTERYINRWNLQKKDPKAAVSEPVKPIVWTIDPSIPAKWRPSVKEGILRWNKAFDALGYKNAVQVQDAPTDADYDHADGRLNVIRMTMSEDAAYAIALARTDPFTGEVVNAAVTLDANMLSTTAFEHSDSIITGQASYDRSMSVLRRGNVAPGKVAEFLEASERDEAAERSQAVARKFGWTAPACTYAHDHLADLEYGWSAVAALGPVLGVKISRDKYIEQFMADVVSHEIGHTMGLRHNFAASTALTTAQLADDALTSRLGITASVMDYTPFNSVAVLKGAKNYYMPTIGQYDIWAIRYGYMDVVATSPIGEKAALSKVAAQSGQPGLAFMTDEDADAWNPTVLRFDQAKDSIVYSLNNLILARKMRDYAIKNLPRPGESYAARTEMLQQAFGRTFREARFLARFVGGVVATRQFRGDANEKPTLAPVSPALQRQATHIITANLLSANAFNLPESVLNSMSGDKNKDATANWTAPFRSLIAARQRLALVQLLSADTTDRVAENAFKTSKGAYEVDEHYGIIVSSVFSEVGKGVKIPALRRDLQRLAVSALISQASAPQGAINEDTRTVAADSVRNLNVRFQEALKNGAGLDSMTRVHLRDAQEQIARFLARQLASAR